MERPIIGTSLSSSTITNESNDTAKEAKATSTNTPNSHRHHRDRSGRKPHLHITINNMHRAHTTLKYSSASSTSTLPLATIQQTSKQQNTKEIYHDVLMIADRPRTNSLPLRRLRTVSGEHLLVVRESWRYPSCIGRVDTLYVWHSESAVIGSGMMYVATATATAEFLVMRYAPNGFCMLLLSSADSSNTGAKWRIGYIMKRTESGVPCVVLLSASILACKDHNKHWYSTATRLRRSLHIDLYTAFGDTCSASCIWSCGDP